jgi:hypothetical protein
MSYDEYQKFIADALAAACEHLAEEGGIKREDLGLIASFINSVELFSKLVPDEEVES